MTTESFIKDIEELVRDRPNNDVLRVAEKHGRRGSIYMDYDPVCDMHHIWTGNEDFNRAFESLEKGVKYFEKMYNLIGE